MSSGSIIAVEPLWPSRRECLPGSFLSEGVGEGTAVVFSHADHLFKVPGGHAKNFGSACLGVLDDMQVATDVGLSNQGLGIQGCNYEELEAELSEEFECILGILVIDLGEHLVDND